MPIERKEWILEGTENGRRVNYYFSVDGETIGRDLTTPPFALEGRRNRPLEELEDDVAFAYGVAVALSSAHQTQFHRVAITDYIPPGTQIFAMGKSASGYLINVGREQL